MTFNYAFGSWMDFPASMHQQWHARARFFFFHLTCLSPFFSVSFAKQTRYWTTTFSFSTVILCKLLFVSFVYTERKNWFSAKFSFDCVFFSFSFSFIFLFSSLYTIFFCTISFTIISMFRMFVCLFFRSIWKIPHFRLCFYFFSVFWWFLQS